MLQTKIPSLIHQNLTTSLNTSIKNLQEMVDENREMNIVGKEEIRVIFTQIYVKSTPIYSESDGT